MEEPSMCVPADAELPDLPIEYPLPAGQRITLTSEDGTLLAAHEAAAPAPSGNGIVLLPDVRGLFSFYERLTEAFAAAGFDAIAIDYFARTSDIAERGADFEPWPHVEQLTPDQLRGDVAAAVARLRDEHGARRVVTVGFCLGGRVSLRQGFAGHGLAGTVALYGSPAGRGNLPSATEHAADFECPVLGLYGGADQGIPVEDVAAFGSALEAAGVPHELHVYPGAPHSFFDRSYADFADECRDAWSRIVTFASA
jgi:carboxymethylenebutenolidase